MDKSILLSVIVPCYNVEQYVQKCVESLINITLEEVEFIFVDDGSSDQTYNILLSYKDARLRVYKKQNGGPSSARNYGLEKAKGDFIMFVDGDDYIFSDNIEKIIQELDSSKELICFKYTRKDKNDISEHIQEGISLCSAKKVREGILNVDSQLIQELIKKGYHFHGPWGKCYSRKIINEFVVRFPKNLRWGEDICFNLMYLSHISQINLVPLVGYFYRLNEVSLISSYYPNKGSQMKRLIKEVWKLVEKTELEETYKFFAARQYLYILQEEICNPMNKEKYSIKKKKAWKTIRENELIKDAIDTVKLKEMGKKPAILVLLLRIKCFFLIYMLFNFKFCIVSKRKSKL